VLGRHELHGRALGQGRETSKKDEAKQKKNDVAVNNQKQRLWNGKMVLIMYIGN
jgi:hypothetical protein